MATAKARFWFKDIPIEGEVTDSTVKFWVNQDAISRDTLRNEVARRFPGFRVQIGTIDNKRFGHCWVVIGDRITPETYKSKAIALEVARVKLPKVENIWNLTVITELDVFLAQNPRLDPEDAKAIRALSEGECFTANCGAGGVWRVTALGVGA